MDLNGNPLHSTMFLLIPWADYRYKTSIVTFTFHYVSINTHTLFCRISFLLSLHSTMFLLIRGNSSGDNYGLHCFTFHYVSINTIPGRESAGNLYHFTFHYVSINTNMNSG